MSHKYTYTQVLNNLNREIKISGFESRYLGILFGLLGISLPLLLVKNTFNTGFMPEIISIGLIVYAPMILFSLIVYYFSEDKNIILKKISVTITSVAGLFIVLFILLVSLDYKFQLLTKYSPYTIWGFFIIYFVIGIFIYYRINSMMNEIFKQID